MKRFVLLSLMLIATNGVVSGQETKIDSLSAANSINIDEKSLDIQDKNKVLTEQEFRDLYSEVLSDIDFFVNRTELYCSKIRDIWYSAIHNDNYTYNGNKVKDFNEALSLYFNERYSDDYEWTKYKLYRSDASAIKSTIKSMNKFPTQCEAAFNELIQLGIMVEEFSDYAISPSGSYNSYSEESKSLYKQIRRKLYELEMKYTD